MILKMKILKISLKQRSLIKYYLKKLLLKTSAALYQRFPNFLEKKSATHARKRNSFETNNYSNQLLGGLKNVRYNLLLKTIFEVLVFQICS